VVINFPDDYNEFPLKISELTTLVKYTIYKTDAHLHAEITKKTTNRTTFKCTNKAFAVLVP